MIQRIQTLYLFVGALALGSLSFFASLWSSTASEAYVWYEPAVAGLIALAAVTALGSIFLYSNRETQRKVVVGAQLLTFLLAMTLYGGLYLTNELSVRTGGAFNASKTAMLLMPAVAYVLFLLARRGIDHDIELVESMDRLR